VAFETFAKSQQGYTYLVVLAMIALINLAAVKLVEVWHTQIAREKELELLFVGNEFRKAIALYYEMSPGTVKRFPPTFIDLLKDPRQLATQRYLRRIYRDPISLNTQWGVVSAPGGGIMGVYSLSDKTPVKTANFPAGLESFEGKQHYSDWRFVYSPPAPITTTPTTAK
jgi:type II secretory pathway pseudopilin PulG